MDRCGPLGRSARKDPAGDGAGPLRARLRLLGLRTPRRRRLSPETKREGGVSERSLGARKPQAQLVRASGGFIRGGWGLRALPRRSKTSRPPCVCSCRVFKNPARPSRSCGVRGLDAHSCTLTPSPADDTTGGPADGSPGRLHRCKSRRAGRGMGAFAGDEEGRLWEDESRRKPRRGRGFRGSLGVPRRL